MGAWRALCRRVDSHEEALRIAVGPYRAKAAVPESQAASIINVHVGAGRASHLIQTADWAIESSVAESRPMSSLEAVIAFYRVQGAWLGRGRAGRAPTSLRAQSFAAFRHRFGPDHRPVCPGRARAQRAARTPGKAVPRFGTGAVVALKESDRSELIAIGPCWAIAERRCIRSCRTIVARWARCLTALYERPGAGCVAVQAFGA